MKKKLPLGMKAGPEAVYTKDTRRTQQSDIATFNSATQKDSLHPGLTGYFAAQYRLPTTLASLYLAWRYPK